MFGSKTPFGGGGFGSSSNAFGAQQSTPFGSSSGGLFGNKTPVAGTFGTPSFGTPASGGLFGGTTSTGTSLFGNKPTQASSGFGGFSSNTGTSGGLFGGGGSSLFQTPSTSNAFGAKSSGFGGFGTTNTNVFGSTSNTFGTSNTGSSGGLFGGGSSMFGGGQQTSGTTIKFVPVTSQEQTQKSGISMTVKTQNQCITVMDAYKDKSIEELRLEDYAANRKGSSTSGFGGGGSLFGNTSSTGTSLFGGATSKPSAFGGFGTSTASNTGGLFGQTGTSGGLFGAKTTNSIFGSTNTTSTGFGFGTSTGGGGLFGTTNTGTSLFGTTTTTQSSGLFGGTSAFGSTNTSSGGLFGNTSTFGQPSSQSTGLFGSKPAFGGFGSSSSGGFGTSNTFSFGGANTSTGTSLFGNTATSKPGFTFGGNTGFGTSTSGFGGFGSTATSSSGGLFGNTSGGLFGNKTTGGFGTTGFGANTGTSGSSLFGNTGFGTSTSGFGSLGGGTSTLGGSSIGGLSNVDQGLLTAFQQQQMLQKQLKAIANSPFGDSPLFKNLPEKSKESSQVQPVIHKASGDSILGKSQYKVICRPAMKVKPRPVSSPSLGKSRLFEGFDDDGDFSPHPLKPKNSVKKLLIKNKNEKLSNTPDVDRQLKFRAPSEEESLVAPSPDFIKAKTSTVAKNFGGAHKDSPLQNGGLFENTISDLNGNVATPVNNVKKNYILTPDTNEKPSKVAFELSPANVSSIDEVSASKVILKRSEYHCKPSIAELDGMVSDGQCLVKDFIVGRDGYGSVKFLGVVNVYGLNLDEIVFFRRREVEVYPDDYEGKPEVGHELNRPAEITLLKVWPSDKTSLTPIKSPVRLKNSGFIEKIEEKTLEMGAVFIDYKPDQGAWVFKVNHFTRYGMNEQFINDNKDDSAKSILKKKLEEKTSKYLGSEVHFPRDGITDFTKENLIPKIDEKIDEKIAEKMKNKELSINPEADNVAEESEETIDDVDENYYVNDDTDENMGDDVLPMSHQLGRVSGVQALQVQRMKSFLLDETEDDDFQPMRGKQNISYHKSLFNTSSITDVKKEAGFPKLDLSIAANEKQSLNNTLNSTLFKNLKGPSEPNSKVMKKSHIFRTDVGGTPNDIEAVTRQERKIETMPKKREPLKCRNFTEIPYEQSLMFGKFSSLCDAGLSHGREFNICWKNQLTFLHTGHKLGEVSSETLTCNANIFVNNYSTSQPLKGLPNTIVNIEQLDIQRNNNTLYEYSKECLQIILKKTKFTKHSNHALPSVSLDSGAKCFEEFSLITDQFRRAVTKDADKAYYKMNQDVWKLSKALWGEQENGDANSLYDIHAARRTAFSDWLKETLSQDINNEVAKARFQDNGHLKMIFSLISGKQIEKACSVAQENKDFRMAMFISQMTGDERLKHFMRHQLDQWEERNCDVFMNEERLKVYVLLSGMMVWKSSHHFINLCENLDWKRALALHLWFYNSNNSTIYDAFTSYQNSFKGSDTYDSYSKYPHPSYTVGLSNKSKDICYHLLALYCKRLHSLEKLLSTQTHTNNSLDYHLSWHLHEVIRSVGYTHLRDDRSTHLHHSYAAQLEYLGLWHWAVFVYLHLEETERREYYIRNLLNRYCRVHEQEGCIDLNDNERMITEDFHVPVSWIHESKALHAEYTGRHFEQALHLIRAGQWNDAHVVVMKHIAVEAIIDEELDLLKGLLLDLEPMERCCLIKNWKTGGQVFLDYIILSEKIDEMKTSNGVSKYSLEEMELRVSSLINRIGIMNINDSRQRYCQSEMARNCTHMIKILFAYMEQHTSGGDFEMTHATSLKVAPYVAELPLPPDTYMKELREVLASYVHSI